MSASTLPPADCDPGDGARHDCGRCVDTPAPHICGTATRGLADGRHQRRPAVRHPHCTSGMSPATWRPLMHDPRPALALLLCQGLALLALLGYWLSVPPAIRQA